MPLNAADLANHLEQTRARLIALPQPDSALATARHKLTVFDILTETMDSDYAEVVHRLMNDRAAAAQAPMERLEAIAQHIRELTGEDVIEEMARIGEVAKREAARRQWRSDRDYKRRGYVKRAGTHATEAATIVWVQE